MSAPRSASDSQSKLAGSADGSALLPTLADTMEFCPLVPPTGCHPVDRRPTIQDIFRLYGQAYMEKYADRMSLDQIRVMDAITHCRSEEAGYIEFDCLACDHKHRVPKACGNLNYHPHLHFVVPGGALSEDGQQWLSSRVDFLVPVEAVFKLFRAKFRDRMREEALSTDDRYRRGVHSPFSAACAAQRFSEGKAFWFYAQTLQGIVSVASDAGHRDTQPGVC